MKLPGMVREVLTSQEAKQLTLGPSVTTVTWFSGDAQVATKSLGERLWAVVQLNPWLAGSLVKSSGSLYLCWPEETKESEALARLFNPTTSKRRSLVGKMRSSMGFSAQCNVVGGSAAEIPEGRSCIGNGAPLVAVSVVNCAEKPGKRFAVVYSLSHVITDGFTYYMLLSMLSSSGCEPRALSAKRKAGIVESTKEFVGADEFKFLNSNAVICNVLCSCSVGRSRPFATTSLTRPR